MTHERYGRVRVHLARSHTSQDVRGTYHLSLRFLAEEIPDARELGIPNVVLELCEREHLSGGLILVAGATGQGKTTALAALLERINLNCDAHIITLEDPIEYELHGRRSHISQREIGRDIASYEDGIFAALRMDPDVLCIAELRSPAAIIAALRAAETGHLVFATVHASDSVAAIERLIHACGEVQDEIRSSLSMSLHAIVGIRLLPRSNGEGRVAAYEVLVANEPIRALIREKKAHHIRNAVATGRASGMHTFEYALQGLLRSGVIDERIARAASAYPDELTIPSTLR
jgi:twitching motility protein PilT